jgi:hypothetical protein
LLKNNILAVDDSECLNLGIGEKERGTAQIDGDILQMIVQIFWSHQNVDLLAVRAGYGPCGLKIIGAGCCYDLRIWNRRITAVIM